MRTCTPERAEKTTLRIAILPGELGDQFHLRSKLEMKIEYDKQADYDPYIDDQVDAAGQYQLSAREKTWHAWVTHYEIKPTTRSEPRDKAITGELHYR